MHYCYCTLPLQVNKHGTLFKGSLAAGAVCIAIAAWVPFAYLDDMISAGVLLCFNAANSSLLVSTHTTDYMHADARLP
jgi:hypothetical protein